MISQQLTIARQTKRVTLLAAIVFLVLEQCTWQWHCLPWQLVMTSSPSDHLSLVRDGSLRVTINIWQLIFICLLGVSIIITYWFYLFLVLKLRGSFRFSEACSSVACSIEQAIPGSFRFFQSIYRTGSMVYLYATPLWLGPIAKSDLTRPNWYVWNYFQVVFFLNFPWKIWFFLCDVIDVFSHI